MSWFLSAAAERLRDEINTLFADRDKASDGAVGDSKHSARTSDHNPDDKAGGVVRAIDVDEDLWGAKHGDPVMANTLVRKLTEIAKTDGRISYIIFEGKIWSKTLNWKGRPYSGANPHNHHIHISFTPKGDKDGSPFGLVKELKQRVVAEKPTVAKKKASK